MTSQQHELAQRFFTAVETGDLPDDLFTEDMTAWTLSSGDSDKARFLGGIKMLSMIVEGEMVYNIHSITAEDDRVVAEASSEWPLINGQQAVNKHVFIFTLRGNQIASVAEYMDPTVPKTIIGPLIQETLSKAN